MVPYDDSAAVFDSYHDGAFSRRLVAAVASRTFDVSRYSREYDDTPLLTLIQFPFPMSAPQVIRVGHGTAIEVFGAAESFTYSPNKLTQVRSCSILYRVPILRPNRLRLTARPQHMVSSLDQAQTKDISIGHHARGLGEYKIRSRKHGYQTPTATFNLPS